MSEHSPLIKPNPSPDPRTPGRRWSPRWVRLAGSLAGILLAAGLVMLVFWLLPRLRKADPAPPTTSGAQVDQQYDVKISKDWQRPVVNEDQLAQNSGIKIVQVAVTGEGGLIDLRFQVLNPDKAVTVHDALPAVVDEGSGVVASELLMGHSHEGTFVAGETYYFIFNNPGNMVQRGDYVNVLLGNSEVDHITIR